MQHYACEQLIFIVDAAYTKKLLNIRFGAQIAQSTQILQDKERLFSKKGLLATYPIYYLVENGAILKKETLSVSQKEAFGFYKEEAEKLCK